MPGTPCRTAFCCPAPSFPRARPAALRLLPPDLPTIVRPCWQWSTHWRRTRSEEVMVVSRRGARAALVAALVAIAIPCAAQPAQDPAAAQALRSEIDQLKQ